MSIQFPMLGDIPKSRDMTTQFGGYNHGARIADNEFFEMSNMDSAHFPLLSPRSKRGKVRSFTAPNGLFAHKKLCWVDGTAFYYDGTAVSGFTLTNGAKKFIGMGAYILIWPDKKYYNTADGTFGSLSQKNVTSTQVTLKLCKNDGTSYDAKTTSNTTSGTVTITLCSASGTAFSASAITTTKPTGTIADKTYWLDTSKTTPELNQYSTTKKDWSVVSPTFLKIAASGINTNLAAGDSVVISGMTNAALNKSYVIEKVDTGYIVVRGIMTSSTATQNAAITVKCRVYTDKLEPPAPVAGMFWMDTSVTPCVLRQYYEATGVWNSIITTSVMISATGIGTGLSQYDGVTISGLTGDASKFNADVLIQKVEANYIVITGILSAELTQNAAVTVERKVPDMDYLTENENRVWGCSSAKHEIYACKQGDPKNWNVFGSLSTDSYAATIGSPGDFTGAVTHAGYVMFFKEDIIHKVMGVKPSNYQVTPLNCRGCAKGSDKSLVIVNESLYYKARSDVCAYAQSMPEPVSAALGVEMSYKNAVAGAYRSKYFISMQDDSGTYRLFVYDCSKGLWYKQDNVQVSYFAAYNGELYFINATDKCLYSVGGNITDYADNNAALETRVDWSVETGDIGLEMPDYKYISNLQIRLHVKSGARVRVFTQFDHSGEWLEVCCINPEKTRSVTIPILTARCDTARIKIQGRGECDIYSITKTIEQGSEI